MRIQLTAIALLSLFASCSKKHKNDLEKNNVNGNVLQITLNSYEAEIKFGDVVKGKMEQHAVYEVNTDGNTASSDQTYYYGAADSAEVDNVKYVNEFDGEGNNIKSVNAKDPKTFSKRTYDSGLMVEDDFMDKGKLVSKTKYVYTDGLLTEVNSYDASGKLTSKDKIKKNAKALDIEVQSFKGTGELDHKKVMTYDDKNNLLTEKQVGGDYPYSANFKYLDNDKNGNWLKAVRYINGKPITYIERVLKYR